MSSALSLVVVGTMSSSSIALAHPRRQRGAQPANGLHETCSPCRSSDGAAAWKYILGSIVRTEAVRPFPVPEREIIIVRDIDTGVEPGELPSPARERAHSEAE